MADNYLEKKMEELRSGVTSGRRAPRRSCVAASAASMRAPGDFTVRFPELRVFVCGDAATPLGHAVVGALREVGCKVAFSGTDSATGTEMARSLGAQFHPLRNPSDDGSLAVSARYTLRNWRAIDVVIGLGFTPRFLPEASRIISVLPAHSPAAQGLYDASVPGDATCVIPLTAASDDEVAALCRLLLSPDASILPRAMVLLVSGPIFTPEP